MSATVSRRQVAALLLTAGGTGVAAPASAAAVAAEAMEPAGCFSRPSMSRERFQAYIDAFNRDDYSGLATTTPRMWCWVIAGQRELHGRQAIFDFYKVVKSQTHRTIQVNKFIGTENRIAVELQSEFLALEDLPDFSVGPMKKGGRIFINTFVIYDLAGGKFARIRSAEFRKIDRQVSPAAPA